ncbi:hypothetical protein QPL79_00125 [Ignisphaera sp. 4213-co]|uniref:Uncharacterized protein n=1 Tax=Ignisphaera cupida TaxID=3050454 RepID=A0ABD4Z389_9CREN|nr:hypothetical protein [Ignisphaera sp. 4213-co]MDK6027781.1 hypothetical protein [Ignisphaera sp. 4213-co]
MSIDALRLAILDAFHRYGQKFVLVMKAALSVARENKLRGSNSMGDFDYKGVVEKLNSMGYSYNPSLLLKTLEKEYRIIETSYKTSNQHWYKFRYGIEVLESIIDSIVKGSEDLEDPDITLIKIQFRSLRPRYWLNKLKNMGVKEKLSKADIKIFQRFSFAILPKLIKILKQAEEFEDELFIEINVLREVIQLAQLIAEKIDYVELGNKISIDSQVVQHM